MQRGPLSAPLDEVIEKINHFKLVSQQDEMTSLYLHALLENVKQIDPQLHVSEQNEQALAILKGMLLSARKVAADVEAGNAPQFQHFRPDLTTDLCHVIAQDIFYILLPQAHQTDYEDPNLLAFDAQVVESFDATRDSMMYLNNHLRNVSFVYDIYREASSLHQLHFHRKRIATLEQKLIEITNSDLSLLEKLNLAKAAVDAQGGKANSKTHFKKFCYDASEHLKELINQVLWAASGFNLLRRKMNERDERMNSPSPMRN